MPDRREFLMTVATLAAVAAAPRWLEPQAPRTRLILLGTGGGPRPRVGSNPTSQVIVAKDRLYVVDCGVPNAATLRRHLLASHTSAEDCGRVAAAAGVKTLVLSHFVPADDPLVTEKMWADTARQDFTGTIIVGRDLMEI